MPRTVHNLDIYPHSGPQCVGCIVLDDPEPGADESAPLAEPATATDETAAADDGPTAPAAPPPEPKPHPLLRVDLDADVLVEDEGCRVAYSVRVTLYGRAAARARIVVRDRDGAALVTFEADLTEGTALVRGGTAPLAGDLDLVADATLVDDAAVTDSAEALVFPPVLAVAGSPALDSVRLAAPPLWATRAGTGEEDAVRTPALLSSAEEGVVFVRPDVALDPPLRVEARGSGLTGRTAKAVLMTPEGTTLAEGTAPCAEDERVECTFDRIPGAAFGKARVVRAFVRVSVDEVSAETPSPLTLVRIAPVTLGDARPTQCTYDLVYAIMALGTPTIAPPAKARVSSMYRDAEHQLNLLRGFAHDLGIPHAGMKVEDVSTWGPVLDRVRAAKIAIAAPADAEREITVKGKDGAPKTIKRKYGTSNHVRGRAVDFAPRKGGPTLDEIDERVKDICAYHGVAPATLREPKNHCVHVAYVERGASAPAPKPKDAPKPKLAAAAGAATAPPAATPGFPPSALSVDPDRFRLADAAPFSRHVLGAKGHEEMLLCVARSGRPPADSPRPYNRRFRVVLFVHGHMSAKWTPFYRTADAVFVKKRFADLVTRMNAAGHNVAFGVLCDQLNGPGRRYKEMKAPEYFQEALDLARSKTRELHPDATFEGVSLIVHSGAGAVANRWLKAASVRAALREENGEVVFLDAYYIPGDAALLHYVAEGGLTTLAAHVKPVQHNAHRLADAAGCGPVTTDGRRTNAAGTVVVIKTKLDHERCSTDWPVFLPHLFHGPAEPECFYASTRRPMTAVATPPKDEHTECEPLRDDEGGEDDSLAQLAALTAFMGEELEPAGAEIRVTDEPDGSESV